MKLFWTKKAQRDRFSILNYISDYNPSAALKMDDRFVEAAEMVAEQPNMGVLGDIEGTREFVAHENYRLIYEVRPAGVFVISVTHSARQWPPVEGD